MPGNLRCAALAFAVLFGGFFVSYAKANTATDGLQVCALPKEFLTVGSENWSPLAMTSTSITGAIVLSPTALKFETGAIAKLQFLGSWHLQHARELFSPLGDSPCVSVYAVEPAFQKPLIRKNTICDEKGVGYVVTYREADGLTVLAFSPGYAFSEPASRENQYCGTFTYVKPRP